MKFTKNIFVGVLATAVIFGCNDDGYIDPISTVDPGPDESAPIVTVNYPIEGTLIRVSEDVTPITIQYQATDDIEVETVSIVLDGIEIATASGFKDYRKANGSFTYQELTNGPHVLTVTAVDASGKETSNTVNFEKVEPYDPVYDGEIFYMPFDGDYLELVSIEEATKVGSPTFSDDARAGKSFAGATSAYLTFPTADITNDEFSAVFWYKLNATPDRSGILTIGPPDPNLPATPNNRKNGFRLFRENVGGNQIIKLNVGNGDADNWFDGGAAAAVTPGEWTHVAITISQTKAVVYVNGNIVSQGTFPGVDWSNTDIMSIGSGAPRFMEWGHLSDLSLYDELRIFNRELSQAEIQEIMND